MNYYFEKIEAFVHSLAFAKATTTFNHPAEIENTIEVIIGEKEQIRTNIIQQAFETPEKGMMELFIHKQQSVLTRLLDELHLSKKLNNRIQNEKKLSNALYEQLNELLIFLRTHYLNFFNLEGKIPLVESEKLSHEVEQRLEKITNTLNIYIPDSIVSLLETPIKMLLSKESISYKEADYLKAVIPEFEGVAINNHTEKLLQNFKMMLIVVNFNAPEIGKYFITEWNEEISKEDSIQEKLRILKFNSKETRQMTEKKGWSLNPTEISLKERLLTWLDAEIAYYEAEQSAAVPVQNSLESDAKIHTSMSVPQLALLFRLLKADHQITNTNQSEVLKIVTNSFTTVKKENFSYGHLHGKYYKIEAHTRRTVYDMLMRLLHLSRKIGMGEKV